MRYSACRLTDEQRTILRLHVEEEMSFSEIGKALGDKAPSTAKRRFDAALDALRSGVSARCGDIGAIQPG